MPVCVFVFVLNYCFKEKTKMATFNLVLEFQNVKKQNLLADFADDLHSFQTLPEGGYRVTLLGQSAQKWASIFNECLLYLKHFSDDSGLLLDTRSKLWELMPKGFHSQRLEWVAYFCKDHDLELFKCEKTGLHAVKATRKEYSSESVTMYLADYTV